MKTLMTIVAALTLAMASCQSTENMRVRLMGGASLSEMTGEYEGAKDSGDGLAGSIRAEVSTRPDYIPNVEVGMRVHGGLHDVSEQGVDFDSMDLGATAVIRPYYELPSGTMLYLEGFAGYQHLWGDVSAGGLTEKGNEGGMLFGSGAGAEIPMGDAGSLILGVEWSRNMLDIDDLKLDIDDFTAVVGWSLSW